MSMYRLLLLTLLPFLSFQKNATKHFADIPVSVILDTDMDSDVDDVGALAMLHNYEKQGKAKILGIIVTSDELYSASCTDAINTWYGRGDIPIGVSQTDSLKSFSRYTKQISQQFPSKLKNNTQAKDGTALYRRLLANEPDSSVVIITIGHLTSLSRLLASGPDAISPLTGQQLVDQKVKKWSCMGGQYPSGKEANFYRPDPFSTVQCLTKWRLPVTFVGWELGNLIVTGGAEFKTRGNTKSPVYKGYELYNNFAGRASWDQLSVLEAIEGAEPLFNKATDGRCVVDADGSNTWIGPSNGTHGYLKLKASAAVVQKHVEQLMLDK